MFTNNLKKGTRVMLRGTNWEADILNNLKGNTRYCRVYGFETECGSCYAHDIVAYKDAEGNWKNDIEFTPAQLKCKEMTRKMGW